MNQPRSKRINGFVFGQESMNTFLRFGAFRKDIDNSDISVVSLNTLLWNKYQNSANREFTRPCKKVDSLGPSSSFLFFGTRSGKYVVCNRGTSTGVVATRTYFYKSRTEKSHYYWFSCPWCNCPPSPTLFIFSRMTMSCTHAFHNTR